MARPATAAVRLLTGEREPVRLATTVNIVLYGLQTIDGVPAEVGDRVLVRNQTDGSENGIRTASEGQWYRAADARTARTMQKGTTVHVAEGSTNAGKTFVFNTLDPVIGDTAISIGFYISDTAVTDAQTAATAAAASAASAQVHEGNAGLYSLASAASVTAAAGSATSASTSATNAATSATNAGNSATAASGSASSAATSATNAGNSATAAAASAVAAAASASAINLPAPAANTILVRNAGNTAYDAKTFADTRLALTVPVYVTRANLVGLDTSKDGLAYVTDFGNEAWYKWSGVDLSSRTVVQSITSTSVNSTTEVITKVGHLLSTGSGLMPTTTVSGVTTNTVYYAVIVDADNFKLAATPEDAYAGTPVINLTGTTNFTLKQLRDPLQDVYVIKTGGAVDGTAGAWVKSQAAQDIGISRANYHRFNDRILVGLGATGWMGDKSGTLAPTGVGSWLGDEIASGSSYAMSYLLVSAQVASVTSGIPGHAGTGIFGASKSSEGASTQNFMGMSAYASGHASSGSSVGWAGYFEAVKRPSSNSTLQAIELEITNLNSTPTTPLISSESTYVQGRTFGIFLASGGGNTTTYDADSAIFIGANNSAFRTGITFFKGSLAKDVTTNYQHAIILPNKARIEWDTSDGNANDGFTIHSEVTDSAHAMFMIADNNGLMVSNIAGKVIQRTSYVASSVNYIQYSPAATGSGPNYQAIGDDTNIDISLISKGTGGVRLRDGAAANKLVINNTGIGFFNTTPVAKATVGAALSTGGAETNTNLATRINELRTALINYGLAA